MGLALALGLCAGSLYLCRKMNREIKQANEFRAAAKPKPGAQDNGVELRPADLSSSPQRWSVSKAAYKSLGF